jgi:hypothetical protein
MACFRIAQQKPSFVALVVCRMGQRLRSRSRRLFQLRPHCIKQRFGE